METKYIHRELSAVIEEAYRYFSVITVTGPRQSGKTTLLRNLFSHLPYYSLENLDVRSFAENDPVAFLNQHTEGMILDEVHNAPNLLSYIQGMVDNDADRRFILSGSSQFAMLKKVTQSLAGRTAVFELLPLSYSEIREQVTDTPLDNLLFNGFYPAIYSGRNIPKFLYPAYMKTYLDKDVRYHADFEKALKQMDGWVKETILGKAVAYAGTLENTAGEIKLLNYSHLDEVLA